MAISSGYMVAATAVWAITWVSAAVTKTSKIDHAGFFADDGKHFIGKTLGKPDFCEHKADNYGPEDKHHRRVHEVLEGHICRPGS